MNRPAKRSLQHSVKVSLAGLPTAALNGSNRRQRSWDCNQLFDSPGDPRYDVDQTEYKPRTGPVPVSSAARNLGLIMCRLFGMGTARSLQAEGGLPLPTRLVCLVAAALDWLSTTIPPAWHHAAISIVAAHFLAE